jgi:malate permease and related proteins
MSLGMLLVRLRFVPPSFSQRFGRSLYWIGVPLQIFVLGHQSEFPRAIWLPPLATVLVLMMGWGLATFCWQARQKFTDRYLHKDKNVRSPQREMVAVASRSSSVVALQPEIESFAQIRSKYLSSQGSFILASMLGNTVFVGFALAPTLVDRAYWGWIVLYGITNFVLGSYGLGVLVASYFGSSQRNKRWWISLRNLLYVPALWAFLLGWFSQNFQFPIFLESRLHFIPVVVVASVFLLIGIQLSQLQGIHNFQAAIVPTILKMLILPGVTGIVCLLLGLRGDACLALVIMSGMPTNSANAILAEEYNLDRQMAVSSILLSMIILPLTIPLWLAIF